MSYTAIGYVQTPRSVVFVRQVRELTLIGPEWPRYVSEALKLAYHERNDLYDFRFSAVLQIAAHPSFKAGSSASLALMELLVMVCTDLGVFSFEPKYTSYRLDPVLTFDELVERVVASRVPAMSRDALDGDRTKWGSFIYEFIMHLTNALRITADAKEVETDLEDMRRHFVWTLSHGGALDAASRSFLLAYGCGSPYLTSIQAARTRVIIANQVTLQRTLATWAEAKQHMAPGPISRYFKLFSNKQLESLTALATVGIRSLDLSVGSFFIHGPFMRAKLTPVVSIPFSEKTQMAGLRESMAYPIGLTMPKTNGKDSDAYAELCTPSWPASITRQFIPFSRTSTLAFDVEGVDLKMRGNHLAEDQPYTGLIASWFSDWRGRTVSTLTGADSDDMLTDIALGQESFGGGELGEASINDGDIIPTSEVVKGTLRTRVRTFGNTGIPADGTAELNSTGPISFTIYLRKNGQLVEHVVDVRWYYSQRGAAFVIPAFAEFMKPSLSMLYAPNKTAVDWLASELSLTEEDRLSNEVALEVCWNYNELRALLGTRSLERVDIKQVVKILVGL